MTLRWVLAFSAIGAVLLAGCVTIPDEPGSAAQSASAPVYRTGSRLPSSTNAGTGAPVGMVSPEDWRNARREGTPSGDITR